MSETGRTRDPVARAFQVLRYMIESPQPELGVREIAKDCGLQPSTVHRALSSLLDEGLVIQDPQSEGYRVSLELLRLEGLTHKKADVRAVASRHLRDLVAACNETAILGLYDRNRRQMVRVDCVESSHPLRYVFQLFHWTEVYRGASGLAILANLPEPERSVIIAEAERRGDSPWLSRTVAETELAAVRKAGYAITHGRRIPGAVGISAAIWDHEGNVIGDIILTIPEQRMAEGNAEIYTDLVVTAAKLTSSGLGWHPGAQSS